MTATRMIFFRRLVVQAHIGILEHEKRASQPLHIDAEFEVTAKTPEDEDVDSVLDYRLLREALLEECTQGHTNLLETLIERMATRIFNDFSDVRHLHIRLSKPTVFPDCDAVGIAIRRDR